MNMDDCYISNVFIEDIDNNSLECEEIKNDVSVIYLEEEMDDKKEKTDDQISLSLSKYDICSNNLILFNNDDEKNLNNKHDEIKKIVNINGLNYCEEFEYNAENKLKRINKIKNVYKFAAFSLAVMMTGIIYKD